MPDSVGAEPRTLPETLLRELHGFLSLEAPYLIRDIPPVGDENELEQVLLTRIDERFRTGEQFRGERLFPLVSHQRAVNWSRERVETQVKGFFERRRIKASITPDERVLMLKTMLLTREVDEFLKRAFDRKEIQWGEYPSPQKGFRSTGQEAIVGASLRLRRPPEYGTGDDYTGDFIGPMIRDLGALLMFMPDPLHPILVQYGKKGTPMDGRDIHTGDFAQGVLPPAAPLAISTQTLIGMAYSFKARAEDRVCVSFVGDGASSLGEWHEAINLAGAQKLNMVFVIENNQWALGTHVSEQTAARRFADRAAGYGLPGLTLFGNDPEEVAAGVAWAAERARQGHGPSLIELVTYRRPGHAHHDDDRFHGSAEAKVPGYEFTEELRAWEKADPIDLYAAKLEELGLVSAESRAEMSKAAEVAVLAAAEQAEAAPWPERSDYRGREFAPQPTPKPAPLPESDAAPKTRKMAYDEAVRQALIEMMDEDDDVYVLGEDVGGRYGGAFGVTRGLSKRFGPLRCLNTPLAESAIVGCGVGSALLRMRPVVEIQFADFLAPGFNALVNNAAKLYWRWGRAVPMVVRLPYGGATGDFSKLLGGGPFHSQCPEMWFLRTPGWKIVAPSTPADAKGLMIAAIRDENPVIFLESKGLYGFFRNDLREEVPLGTDHEIEIGKAAIRREGKDLTIVTYGSAVWTALAAGEALAGEKTDVEVLDLRTLWPLDEAAVLESLKKTSRALVVHEDGARGGFGGELAALLFEKAFYALDAPVLRVTAPDNPVPYSPSMERDHLPSVERIVSAARELMSH